MKIFLSCRESLFLLTMRKVYKHIFFDLDHTLWDFERNAEETKRELFEALGLKALGVPGYDEFRLKYVGINTGLWALYREGKIEKDDLNYQRFYRPLCEFGVDDPALAASMASGYIAGISTKTYLFPYAKEILEYLYPNYKIYIITNGFEEVQFSKLRKSGLDRYFTSVITSEEAGSKKPDSSIFHFALKKAGAEIKDSLMIGDDMEVDIGGARNVGMDQLYVNHDGSVHEAKATYEVASLKEIESIL
jgi:putative hydrolase of the HAD superfamily